MTDPSRPKRIFLKLEALWAKHPNATFGQLMEAVENIAWEPAQRSRDFSARLMFLPDEWLETALNEALKPDWKPKLYP